MRIFYQKNNFLVMLIGGDFNKKGKDLLRELESLTHGNVNSQIEVEMLNDALNYDRNEIKNLLEYLENKECVKIATIGGPFLYGHIQITPKGIAKAGK